MRLPLLLSTLALVATTAAAQAPDVTSAGPAAPAAELVFVARTDAAVLDAEALRSELERELGIPVARRETASSTHVLVEAGSLSAVRVAFVRDGAPPVERIADASAAGAHAAETVALLAANLVRDEAAELLAALHAAQPGASTAPPAPAASATPAPATPPRTPAPPPEPREPPPACAPNDLQRVTLGADFVPYLGTSLRHETRVERQISLNLIGGLTGAVHGFELGGVFNLDTRSMCGLQLAGATNLVLGPAQGAQLSLVNVALGRVDGAQLGLVNLAGKPMYGAQLGLTNVAGGAATGVQLGLANVAAGPVRGAMIGLVNVAEDADAAVGLVSVLWNGRTHLDVWGTDAGLLFTGIEHGGRRVHNVYGVGIGVREQRAMPAVAYGIGARVVSSDDLFVDIDLIAHALFLQSPADDEIDLAWVHQLRVPIALRLTPALAIFGGPALNLSIAKGSDNLLSDPALYGSFRLSKDGAETTTRLWPGLTLGVRLL